MSSTVASPAVAVTARAFPRYMVSVSHFPVPRYHARAEGRRGRVQRGRRGRKGRRRRRGRREFGHALGEEGRGGGEGGAAERAERRRGRREFGHAEPGGGFKYFTVGKQNWVRSAWLA